MHHDQRAVVAISALVAVSLALIALLSTAPFLTAADLPEPQPTQHAQRQATPPEPTPQVQQPPNQQTTGAAAEAPRDAPKNDRQGEPPADKPAGPAPERPATAALPAAVVLDNREVSGVLGKEVRSAADENMGRIVDVIVDQAGRARAAVIDFGGFLGVGSRKIAVDWNALRFSPGQERNRVILELTRDQVKAAPEYQEGKPVVVLGALAGFDRVRLTTSATPEK